MSKFRIVKVDNYLARGVPDLLFSPNILPSLLRAIRKFSNMYKTINIDSI